MYGFKIIVEGDYACFTRPEMKVERVSYDVPTPSALEGLLKSVYWKPAIRYCIDKIVVFKPIRFMNVRRNEVKSKAGCSFGKDNSIFADENRSQRATMMLKNVKYGVEFHFEMTGIKSEHDDESEKKHYNIIKRRLENGQCFRTPCLGCSEFPVKSISLVDELPMTEVDSELIAQGDVDLGYMLYGLKFEDGGKPINNDWDKPKFSDKAEAMYYRPHMVNGVIDVARYKGATMC
jgi:CRISPR-associated protein Cas5d